MIWHYTFGQNTKAKFARSHAHLFYLTRTRKDFTFNDMAVRIPSARQTTYADRRANPKGKIPDDVWSFSRVCGTFNERVGVAPLPDAREGAGADRPACRPTPATWCWTRSAARARPAAWPPGWEGRYFGMDLSEKYVQLSRKRIADTLTGKRPTTDIAENPESLRASRRVP